jgi:hypothetical protein
MSSMAVPLKANPEGRHRFNVSGICHVLLHPIGLPLIASAVARQSGSK